jgi:D-methionine transport system substrate-binding protein
MIRLFRPLALALCVFSLSFRAEAADRIKLGVIAGAEEEIAEVALKVAARDGLAVELVTFQDYALPNAALEAGDLDANAFQHQPYLDAQIAAHGYHIVAIGLTTVQPIGLYSRKITSIAGLKDGARIAIPNDPSNGGRALNLLAGQGLLSLKPGRGLTPSITDIAANPRRFDIVELDAAQLPRALADVDAAVINTNYAVDAGLNPARDALAREPVAGNPYGNFVAARVKDRNRPDLLRLVKAFQSPEVRELLQTRFKGAVLPAWME